MIKIEKEPLVFNKTEEGLEVATATFGKVEIQTEEGRWNVSFHLKGNTVHTVPVLAYLPMQPELTKNYTLVQTIKNYLQGREIYVLLN